ncbi:MAG: DUF402 domain-containing protein [bacterium]
MPAPSVKIRGFYSTALTRFLLDHGYKIARPSRQIQERFGFSGVKSPGDIKIRDREDHQGVLLSGDRELVVQLISLFRSHFLDMAVRPAGFGQRAGECPIEAELEMEIEFPGASKAALDTLRDRVTPTVRNHHLLKIVSSLWVELAEEAIRSMPLLKAKLEEGLRETIVLSPLSRQKGLIGLIHVHPEGQEISLRGGKIISLENSHLVMRREFSEAHGCYDGLGLPIEQGDYGITEVTENAWFLQHSYYAQDGSLKGTYWNINTPIEFYPDHIRYLDLHIDVVQKPGLVPQIVDREKLDRAVALGLISPELASRACEVASSLRKKLSV